MKIFIITNAEFINGTWQNATYTDETMARGFYTLAMMSHIRDGIRPRPEIFEDTIEVEVIDTETDPDWTWIEEELEELDKKTEELINELNREVWEYED